MKEHVSWIRLYKGKEEGCLKRARHHVLLIHRRQWIRSMIWSKCLWITEFHIPNVTFGSHVLRTHKSKADKTFALAFCQTFKEFPPSREQHPQKKVLTLTSIMDYCPEVRANRGAGTWSGRMASSLHQAARSGLFSVKGFELQKAWNINTNIINIFKTARSLFPVTLKILTYSILQNFHQK